MQVYAGRGLWIREFSKGRSGEYRRTQTVMPHGAQRELGGGKTPTVSDMAGFMPGILLGDRSKIDREAIKRRPDQGLSSPVVCDAVSGA